MLEGVVSDNFEDIYLKLGICVHYPKSNLYYPRRQFKMFFFFFSELWPFLNLEKLRHFVISVNTEDFFLNLRVSVHYSKSNAYYQGRQFKMHFFFFFQNSPFSTKTFYTLSSTPQRSICIHMRCTSFIYLFFSMKLCDGKRGFLVKFQFSTPLAGSQQANVMT